MTEPTTLADRARTTSSSSAPAAPACGRRSRRRHAGADVGLVCKSLLGKAHTVMAEGGVAAALGARRAGGLVAGPLPRHDGRRQAAQQPADGPAPRAWRRRTGSASSSCGAPSSIGPTDGRILQRPFGGHSHPRLAHVGDRTGLEMIRTLQDRAVAAGIEVYMECTITRLITGPGRRDRRVRLLADDRAADRLPGQGRRPRDRRDRQGLRGHVELVGVQRRRPGARLRRRRRAHRHGVRPVPPDGHGLAAGRPRPARDRGRPRRGRDPAQRGRRAVHVEVPARGPPRTSTPRPTRRPRAGSRRCRQGKETDARRPPGAVDPRQRRARDLHRGPGGPRLAPRRRLPRHQLPARPTTSGASCPRCTTSSRSSPTSTSRRARWRSARRPTT